MPQRLRDVGNDRAKLEGLGHAYHNLSGTYPKPIKIAQPYSNVRCLTCHGGAANFLAKHEKEEIPKLLAGTDSCLDCHGPAHKPTSTKRRRRSRPHPIAPSS